MSAAPTLPAAEHPFGRDAFAEDPYAVYRELRATTPVLLLEPVEAPGVECVVTRHADVERILRDGEHFSVNRLRSPLFRARLEGIDDDLHPENQNPSMLTVDPPHHTRLRKLVSKAFTPRRVAELEPRIAAITDRLLDAIDPAAGFELVNDLAEPLPAIVIAELLGVQAEDHERFRSWARALLRGLVGADAEAHVERFRAARDALRAYLGEVIEARRRAPRGDLITALVEAHDEKDALDARELLATCHLLLVAGHETTTHWIANGTATLLRHGAWAGLREASEDALEHAVEELVRFESPLQMVARVATKPSELCGVTVPEGALITAVVGAANRDPEIFEAPERLDLARDPNPHLAFGLGVHFCLGASLARLEARTVFRRLLARLPALELDGAPRWRRSLVVRGLDALPLRSPWIRSSSSGSSP